MNKKIFQLNANGGWCWFQDDRVLADSETNTVLFTSVGSSGGVNGESRNGDIDVTAFYPASDTADTITLSNILKKGQGDDHNVAALWERPDGRYLAMYTGHNYGAGNHGDPPGVDTQPVSFYRISQDPHNASKWEPEQIFVWPSNDQMGLGANSVTYSNILHLSNEGNRNGRLYNFARAAGQIWHIAISEDWGETWIYSGMLSRPPTGGRAYSNGYVKFSGNGVDRIDFIITEAHPRDFNNGIYHGYIQDGKTHDAAGNVIDSDTLSMDAPPPEAFTPLFIPENVAEGKYHHGWATEIKCGSNGELFALFTTRFGVKCAANQATQLTPGDADHRMFYTRFDGYKWITEELARMGEGLHDGEADYTGLGTIDPRDGHTVYVSTPIDPRSDTRLARYEIFRARRKAHDEPWQWTAVTQESSVDNLRPELALFDGERAMLLWLRGEYPHQRKYNLGIVGQMIARSD